ncbi:MAG: uridine diphosphate-N-acetylglucosamine-binding protein YvcK [Acidimicrobiales bacterium]
MTALAPRVVALGGGHGLATTLTGLVGRAADLTAVVSVADDGGSSGRLRRELGIIAPGDMRRCLEALAPPGLLIDAVAHRFSDGEMAGHVAGNILLAALLEHASDPAAAADALGELLGARGRVLPATLGAVDLLADTEIGVVRGQVRVGRSSGVERVRWDPAEPEVPPDVLVAIGAADLIVLGPGSLYTSVLASVVPAIGRAIASARGRVVYVANLAPQPAETDGYHLADHIAAVLRHGVDPDVVLADADSPDLGDHPDVTVVRARVTGASPRHHDPERLGRALCGLTARVGERGSRASAPGGA